MTTAQSYRLICLLILVAIPVYSRHSWPSTPCPNRCKCYRNTDQLKVLNCSSSGLMQFPNVSRIPFDVNIIDVSTNFIEFIPDDVNMHQLHELVALDLSANFLSNFTRLQIPTLSTLDLSNNYITELSDAVFSGVSALRNLNLSGNRLTVIEAAAFKGLVSLWHLDLSRNKLISLPVLDRLHRLIEVYNPIKFIREGDFTSLPNLRRIDLSRTRIEIVEEGGFANLPSLAWLSLNDNPRLVFLHPESFKNLPSLSTLFLHNSNLSTIHNVYTKLPALQNWTLYGNPLVCDCNMKWLKEYINKDSAKHFNRLLCYPEGRGKLQLVRNVKFDDHCLPRIVHCPSMVQLYEGQLLKLSCQAIGNPVPKVHWYFPKTEKIISRSDAAHIENVNRAHGGVYEFVAESSDGIVRHQVEVKVLFL
uniref:Ig-like domain-containing protein n=1 Tax=Syphacia muris TaxID=451379 RepID=A0A0N5AC24_9BILA